MVWGQGIPHEDRLFSIGRSYRPSRSSTAGSTSIATSVSSQAWSNSFQLSLRNAMFNESFVPMALSCTSLILKKAWKTTATCPDIGSHFLFLSFIGHLKTFHLLSEVMIFTRPRSISNCMRVQSKTDPASSKPCVELACWMSHHQSGTRRG